MKCRKPGTDQEASLTVLANGFPCAEYILPSGTIGTNDSDPNILECFIPVSTGDQLTVNGHWNGSVLHGAFDLLVDGTFVKDQRIEGDKEGKIKHKKRSLKYDKVYDSPQPEGHRSIYPAKVVEGNLHVKELVAEDIDVAETLGGGGSALGVGSLAVVMSVNQNTDHQYDNNYKGITCGAWRKRDVDTTDGGITPTHECEVQDVFSDEVHNSRQSKHRRHLGQTRFGKKPWAIFIFYYRSQVGIRGAGCLPRPDKEFLLEADKGESVVATTEKKAKKGVKKTMEEQVEQEYDDMDVDDYGDNIIVSRQIRQDSMLFMTPAPQERPPKPVAQKQPPKLKLMGRRLPSVSKTPDNRHDSASDRESSDGPFGASVAWSREGSEDDEDEDEQQEPIPFSTFNEAIDDYQAEADILQSTGEEAARGNIPVAPVAQMLPQQSIESSPSARDDGIDVCDEIEPTSGPATPPAAWTEVEVKQEQEQEQKPTSLSDVEYFKKVALATVHPSPVGRAQESDDMPSSDSQDRTYVQTTRGAPASTQMRPPATTTNGMSSPRAPAASSPISIPTTPVTGSGHKRTASLANISRESTPSKRPRSNEKLKAMRAELDKKNKIKAEALKALEESRKRREDEERRLDEADLLEMEELLRQNAEADLEIQDLRNAKAQEDAETEELRAGSVVVEDEVVDVKEE